MTDADLAASIAGEAGALLLALRARGVETGEALGLRGDHEANAMILRRLAAERPDDAILSEETTDDRARCAAERVWIVDPLDGTREFAEGRDDWAVHVGLAIGGHPTVGAVALPARGAVYVSGAVPSRLPLAPCRPRMVVSRTRPPAIAVKAAAAIDAEIVPMGSAGAKIMAVVDGRADIYLHAGGQYEWDSCAPIAVALAAGLHASRLDRRPLSYNHPDPYLPDLVVCHPALAAEVTGILERLAAGG